MRDVHRADDEGEIRVRGPQLSIVVCVLLVDLHLALQMWNTVSAAVQCNTMLYKSVQYSAVE